MKLDIFGIGGAFMDLTFHVSDAQLSKLTLHKGGISFVSSNRQRSIIAELQHSLTGISHGGSVANSIYTAQRLAARCAFAASIGDDKHGCAFAAELSRYGVDIACRPINGGTTNSVLSLITPDGEKTFIVSPELASTFNFCEVPQDLLSASSWLLVEGQLFSYGDESKLTASQCIKFAKEHGIRVALNLGSVSVIDTARELLRHHIQGGRVSLLIGNSEEFQSLCEESDISSCLIWAEQTVPLVVSTLGAQGVIARRGGKSLSVAIPSECHVEDTSGAGDAFLGALLASLCQDEKDLLSALTRANNIAAQVVGQPGARLEIFPGHSSKAQ